MISLSTDEKVIYVAKKHWLMIVLKVIGVVLSIFLPLLLVGIITNTIPDFYPRFFANLFWIFYLTWVLFTWIGLFMFWTDYVLDIWIITNKRIIDIEQKGLFKREISTLRLDQMQDITIENTSLLGSIFGFGQITLQTSGTEKEFFMKNAENIEYAKRVISHLHDTELENNQTVNLDAGTIEALKKAIRG